MANGTKIVIFENQKIEVPADANDDEIKAVLETLPEKNLYNAPIETLKRSGGQFVKDVITPFTQPVETAKSIWELGKSVKNLLFVEGEQENEELARAVGEFFKERYGGIENIKKTFRTDPVGFAADLSLLVSGGAMLPARAPGAVGQTSRAIGQVGRVIDPIVAGSKFLKSKPVKIKGKSYGPGTALTGLGNLVAEGFGWTTGSGGKAVKTAYAAGYAGGDKAKAFSEGRSQNVNRVNQVQNDLTNALDELNNEYLLRFQNSNIGKKLKKTTISAKEIDAILKNIEKISKKDGRLVPDDQIIFDKINALKTDIWKSTHRRNGIGADDFVNELSDLFKNDNNIIARTVRNDVKNLINKKVPNYIEKTKGFEAIVNARNTAKTITEGKDADKILNDIKVIFDKNTQKPVLRDEIRKLDKMKNLNIEEVVAGDRMSGYLPTAENLYMQGMKMGGIGFGQSPLKWLGARGTGGPVSPIFSPNVVSREAKRVGEIARYGPKPLVNALRANRALQQIEDDEVYY
jgi:hypothetical protein